MAALQRPALPFPRRLGARRALARLRSGKLPLVGAGVLLLAAALLQVNQFSTLTSTGYQIDALNEERAAKQAQNRELEAEVARLSSLARVDWEARVRLGMVPASRTLYINVNQPVPGQETLPTRFWPVAPPAAAAEAPGEPWWKRLFKLLPSF